MGRQRRRINTPPCCARSFSSHDLLAAAPIWRLPDKRENERFLFIRCAVVHFLLRNQLKWTYRTGLTNAHRVAYSGIYKRIQMKMNRVSDHPTDLWRGDRTKTF